MFLPGVCHNFLGADSGVFPEFGSNVASGQNTNDTSHDVLMPSGIVEGDLLIAFYDGGNITAGFSGWTEEFDELPGALFTKTAVGGEGTITVTTSSDFTHVANVWRIKAGTWDTAQAIESEFTGNQAATATVDPDSITPSWGKAKNMYLAWALHLGIPINASFSSYPSGYSNGINRDSFYAFAGRSHIGASAMLLDKTASEDPGVFTFSTSSNNSTSGAITVAIRGAS